MKLNIPAVIILVVVILLGAVAVIWCLRTTWQGTFIIDSSRDLAGNWPQFRGPTGQGLATADAAYPTDWDTKAGRNILWQRDLAATGHSSPIVWQDKLFLTGETGNQGHLLCLDAAKGTTLWDIAVATAAPGAIPADGSGLSAPTPATDGRRVYALFATGDLVAADFAGSVTWCRHLCDPVNSFGLSSSPVLWRNLVIVQLDQGHATDDGLSVLMAVDKTSGQPRWSAKRPVPNSWSTPLLIQHEGRVQLVTCAKPWVIAYDPDTGRELWRVQGLGGDVVPMPVYAEGLVFVANDGARVMAINPGGAGDVTKTHVVWTKQDGLPPIVSPLTDGRRVLLVGDGLTCYNAKTGDVLWHQELDEVFWASPALFGNLVYLPAQNGKTLIFELANTYKLLASPDVGDEISASPAFAAGRIYLRTKHRIFCIGEPYSYLN